MLACVLLVAVQQAASTNLSATFTKTYADKTKLRVQLVGEGSGVVRVTSFRPGARLHAQPSQGFLGDIAPSATRGLAVKMGVAGEGALATARAAFKLTATASLPATALHVNQRCGN